MGSVDDTLWQAVSGGLPRMVLVLRMFKDFRRVLSVLCLGLLALCGTVGLPALANAQTSSSSEARYSAVVIDAQSGEVLYSIRADSPRYPASVTKVMTLYLTFEALARGDLRLTDEITMSRHAASMQPTKLGIAPGKTLSVEDAIQAMTIQSANDVAVAMAEHLGGTETRFAAMMTLKAKELGMNNSRFVNACGLPDSRQISTAHDIAILSRAIMRDFPQYYSYFGQNQFTYGRKTMTNHNNLLRTMPGVDGLKTGYTSASGYNLAASAVQGNRRLITVVLGGSSGAMRDGEVARLLNAGFEVARRRDAGEQLASLQNLFESQQFAPAPSSIQLASNTDAEDGEGDEAPTPTAAQPSAPVRIASAAPTRPAAAPSASSAAVLGGGYAIQVGAFRQRSAAQSQLRTLSRRFTDILANVDEEVGSAVNGFFRAQFTGFSAESATDACSALKAKRVACMVIAP